MIVGADATDDRTILIPARGCTACTGCGRCTTRAFSPSPTPRTFLPLAAPPTVREHRLYQADWLMRFYGFTHDEIVPPLRWACWRWTWIPKLAWALAHRSVFR